MKKKKIFLIIVILFTTTLLNAQKVSEERKKFINAITKLNVMDGYDFNLVLRIKDSNNVIWHTSVGNMDLMHYYRYYKNYTDTSYLKFIRDVLLHDKVIEFIEFERRNSLNIISAKKEEFKVIDNIMLTKNWIDTFFVDRKKLNLDYFVNRALRIRLFEKNIGLGATYKNHIIGYMNGHYVNEDYIRADHDPIIIKPPCKSDPSVDLIYLEVYNVAYLVHGYELMHEIMPIYWTKNDTSFCMFYKPDVQICKGACTFSIVTVDKEKTNACDRYKTIVSGAYKEDGSIYTGDGSIKTVNFGKLDGKYYKPVRTGKWKYYNDKREVIKEEDYP